MNKKVIFIFAGGFVVMMTVLVVVMLYNRSNAPEAPQTEVTDGSGLPSGNLGGTQGPGQTGTSSSGGNLGSEDPVPILAPVTPPRNLRGTQGGLIEEGSNGEIVTLPGASTPNPGTTNSTEQPASTDGFITFRELLRNRTGGTTEVDPKVDTSISSSGAATSPGLEIPGKSSVGVSVTPTLQVPTTTPLDEGSIYSQLSRLGISTTEMGKDALTNCIFSYDPAKPNNTNCLEAEFNKNTQTQLSQIQADINSLLSDPNVTSEEVESAINLSCYLSGTVGAKTTADYVTVATRCAQEYQDYLIQKNKNQVSILESQVSIGSANSSQCIVDIIKNTKNPTAADFERAATTCSSGTVYSTGMTTITKEERERLFGQCLIEKANSNEVSGLAITRLKKAAVLCNQMLDAKYVVTN